MDDDEEKYKTLFRNYIADEIEADDIEEIYMNAHQAIRENPEPKKKEGKSKADYAAESKKYKQKKLTAEERKARVEEKIKAFKASQE